MTERSACWAIGPEIRTTAIAAGGRPEESAKMVSRGGGMDRTEPSWLDPVKTKTGAQAALTAERSDRIYGPQRSYPMPFHIRNRETDRLIRELARTAKLGLTEAVHVAVSNELRRRERNVPLWQRIAALRKRVKSRIKDGRPISKAFRDDLYEGKYDRVR
jgi:antitoxin VapB